MTRRGRYKSIDLKKLESLAALGLTYEQLAHNLGIHDNTLRENRRENVEIQEAIERGRAKGVTAVTNALFNAAVKGNVAAIQYFLNNRDKANWQNMNKTEIEPIKVESRLAKEDMDALKAEINKWNEEI